MIEARGRRIVWAAVVCVVLALVAVLLLLARSRDDPGVIAPAAPTRAGTAAPEPGGADAPARAPAPRAQRAGTPAAGEPAMQRRVAVTVYQDPFASVVVPSARVLLRDATGREHEATTDAAGTTAFDDVPPGDFSVRAEADGCVASEWSPPRDVATEVVILLRGVALEGRVIDALGRPVEGAEVVVASSHALHAGREEIWFVPVSVEAGVVHARTRTDADGRFRAQWIPPQRPVLVRAAADGLGPAEVEAQARKLGDAGPARDVVIVVEPCGALAGRVMNGDGAPVPGALVCVAEETDAEAVDGIAAGSVPGRFHRAGLLTATSDAAGRFRVTGLRTGRIYAAAAQGDRVAPSEVAHGIVVTAATDVAERDFVLRRKATVVVRVVGPDGKPPEDSWASCETSTAGSTQPGSGVHECWHVVPGRRGVSAQAKGCPRETATVDVPDGGRIDVTIHLSRGISWTAIVVDPEGNPLEGRSVRATSGDASSVQAQTDASGRATLEGLRAGPHDVEVWGPDFARRRLTTEFAAGTPPFRIALAKGGLLRGVVKRADGLRGVQYVEVKGDVDETRFTAEDGRFEVRLPPGRYDVKAWGAESSKGVVVEEGGTTEVELTIP